MGFSYIKVSPKTKQAFYNEWLLMHFVSDTGQSKEVTSGSQLSLFRAFRQKLVKWVGGILGLGKEFCIYWFLQVFNVKNLVGISEFITSFEYGIDSINIGIDESSQAGSA